MVVTSIVMRDINYNCLSLLILMELVCTVIDNCQFGLLQMQVLYSFAYPYLTMLVCVLETLDFNLLNVSKEFMIDFH